MSHPPEATQSRRAWLGGAAALAALRRPGAAAPAARGYYVYVGSFTTEQRRARGDGIHVYRMHAETGEWTHLQHLGTLVNPSFLILSRDQRFLYSAHGDEGYATAFAVDRGSGRLTRLNQAATGGVNGAHLALDPSGRYLVVANYASGTVAVLPVRPDGTVADQVQLAELRGQPGPHRVEQTSSHPHDVVFDPSGRFVAVPDKGLDRVFVFRFDPGAGRLSPTAQGSVAARSGSAPRHIAFHPKLPVAWVINEIGSSVTTYHWDAQEGSLRPVLILPSLPPEFTGNNTGAEILASADGRFVYASNRGHDSVAIFATDPKTGLPRSVGWVSTQGKGPRFIALDPSGRFLYAANEQGDTIVAFRVDAATGLLRPAGHVIRNASPATMAFAEAG